MAKLSGRLRAPVSVAATAIACGLALSPVASSAAGAAGAEPTVGNSYAQTIQLDPRTAGLSYQITFGAALANHQNTVARAQAQTANMGVIGTALVAPGCDGSDGYIPPDSLPTPVKVDSREDGAAEGKTEHTGPWEQTARATDKPFSESFTKLAPFSLGGIVTVLGGISRSTSGLDKDGKPLTTADVKISGIDVLNGVVRLEGLHWHSASRVGQVDPATSFSVENAKFSGVSAPNANALEALERANLVLLPFGIQLGTPKIHTDNGTTFVDPLRIAIVESNLRDQVVARITSAAQPLREQVFGYLIENAPCEYNPAALILVTDILTLSVTGGGSLGINLGGTQATVKKLEAASLAPGVTVPTAPSNAGSGTSPYPIVDDSARDTPVPPLTNLDTSGSTGTDTGGGTRRAIRASDTDDNDNAMWVALAVIGLGLALVEGEVRIRRNAAKAVAS